MSQSDTRFNSNVVIIGGGIAGLAAAFRLTQIVPTSRITLIEQDEHLGGKIKTERADGFVIEAGPDSFLSSKPRGIGLCRELGIENRLQGVNQETRRTFVMRDGRLYDLPEGLTGLIPTRLKPLLSSRLLSAPGKARIVLDYVMPTRKGSGDESLALFIQRRLGTEVYERLVEPLMAGIYAGDGRVLSLEATFPQLRRAEVEHGGLIKGILASRSAIPPTQNGSAPRSPFLAPVSGMAELVDSLEQRLAGAGVRILMRTAAQRIVSLPGGEYRVTLDTGQTIPADRVILATPAAATAALVAEMHPDAASILRTIPHVSTALVTFAFREQALTRPFFGHGYIIPRVEGRSALACTWVSSKWNHRAPEGFALVRVFIGRAGTDHLTAADDEVLVSLTREELRATLGVEAQPSLTRIRRWRDGMPQYTLGHLERVAALEQIVASSPGLQIAGHAYRGVGIPDCIASGERAADQASEGLRCRLSGND
ncbi:MAG TPA: protoporphyrinogen oxidase [Thermomicrobiales bacterium]|nr:protoporphyrinogen oxidase [Thermomicrobiales bacterium]